MEDGIIYRKIVTPKGYTIAIGHGKMEKTLAIQFQYDVDAKPGSYPKHTMEMFFLMEPAEVKRLATVLLETVEKLMEHETPSDLN